MVERGHPFSEGKVQFLILMCMHGLSEMPLALHSFSTSVT